MTLASRAAGMRARLPASFVYLRRLETKSQGHAPLADHNAMESEGGPGLEARLNRAACVAAERAAGQVVVGQRGSSRETLLLAKPDPCTSEGALQLTVPAPLRLDFHMMRDSMAMV